MAVGLDGIMNVWKVSVKGGAIPPHNFEPAPQMLAGTQRNRISEIRIVRKNIALARTWDQKDHFIRIDPNTEDGDELSASEFRQNLAISLDLARTSAIRINEFSLVKLWMEGRDKPPQGLVEFFGRRPIGKNSHSTLAR